jgi:hypothetical protein
VGYLHRQQHQGVDKGEACKGMRRWKVGIRSQVTGLISYVTPWTNKSSFAFLSNKIALNECAEGKQIFKNFSDCKRYKSLHAVVRPWRGRVHHLTMVLPPAWCRLLTLMWSWSSLSFTCSGADPGG